MGSTIFMNKVFTEVEGVIGAKCDEGLDLGRYRINPELRLVRCSADTCEFKATPWGIGVVELLIVYDSNNRSGCYTIVPRFLFHGVEAYICCPDVRIHSLASGYLKDIDMIDFLQIMQESIKSSSIEFKCGDPRFNEGSMDFSLRFRNDIIYRNYFNRTGCVSFKTLDMDGEVKVLYQIDLTSMDKHSRFRLKYRNSDFEGYYKISIPAACK